MSLSNISLAIPDTFCTNYQNTLQKNIAVGEIGRICSIFKINKIFIYSEKKNKPNKKNIILICKILRYMNTPQYLRKILFPLDPDLKNVGILPPLRTPNHKLNVPLEKIQKNEIREGVVIGHNGSHVKVYVGLDKPVILKNNLKIGTQVTVKINKINSSLTGEIIHNKTLLSQGYEVKVNETGLISLLDKLSDHQILVTSKTGKPISNLFSELNFFLNSHQNILIIFGGPKNGIHKILKQDELSRISNSLIINSIPEQNTETIRLEEAIIATFSILNAIKN